MKRYSIVQDDLSKCIICDTNRNIHIHHIFGGTANRSKSEEFHCLAALCARHHNGSSNSVHFNKTMDDNLKKYAQKRFEEVYPELSFRDIFGKNF
jgi:hypothetical protein